jgi:RNA polymerase sigma-70 factor (ECF subfamily)
VEYANLSVSPAFLTHRYPGLSFFSESTLAWPLSRPSDAGSWASTSPEFEVVALFEELRDHLLRYLLSLGLSAHDGEEIIQESFLFLFQHLRAGKSRENLRGWVFRVARNLALKQRAADRRNLLRSTEFDETLHEPQMGFGLNPEEELCNRRRQLRLLAVVESLPERDRSCLQLRAEGLRYREIAQTLGISLGSVAASLAKSLAKLSRVDGGGCAR